MDATVDNAQQIQDHRLVMACTHLQVTAAMDHSIGRMPRLDVASLGQTQVQDALSRALTLMLVPGWEVDAHAHAARLAAQLRELVDSVVLPVPVRKRKLHYTPE